jgi:hypothetical protein
MVGGDRSNMKKKVKKRRRRRRKWRTKSI